MKKVFFDIGTNCFQGYDAMYGRLGIDDGWDKVFVEPSPIWTASAEFKERSKTIKNAVYHNKALCCDCERSRGNFLLRFHNDPVPNRFAIDGGSGRMDLGGTIFMNADEWNRCRERLRIEGSSFDAGEVDLVSFDEICAGYMDHEWYLKFDCEGCEWSCLMDIVEKWGAKIKFIICEFHMEMKKVDGYEENVKKKCAEMGIEYCYWG